METRSSTRRERLLRLAKLRSDVAAIAILEGGRTWTPEPDAAPMFIVRLRAAA